MADITVTPSGQLGDLSQSSTIGTDISVTLIGQSLTLEQAPSASLGYEWRYRPNNISGGGMDLWMWQGDPEIVTIQDVFISGQSLSLNRGTPVIFDFIATSRLLTLAQGTPSLVISDGNIAPVGRQLLLNQSSNIADDLSYTTVGQALALARGTPTTSTAEEIVVAIFSQLLSLNRGDPSIAATAVVIDPASRLLVLTQSPNIVEELLLNLIGQDLRFAQGIPTVSTLIDPGTTVNITGQLLTLSRGDPVGAAANFIPVGRQLTLSIPTAVVRTDDTEEIDGQALSLNQGTPTVVSIPGVTNVFGIPLVLSRGIPIVVTTVDSNITGQQLTLAQGTVTVAITVDTTVPVLGQQLTLAQGSVSVSIDTTVIIPGLDLFLNQGVVDVQDAVNVTEFISGRQLVLSQGTIAVVINEELVDVEIPGLDLVLNQGSVRITSTSINEEIAQEGIELVLNQGAVCISIFDMDVDDNDPAYALEYADSVEYGFESGGVTPTYIPEHCD